MLQIGFFPCLSLLSSLILRYFGGHGYVSQRSIRLKYEMALTQQNDQSRFNFKSMNRHKLFT